jgi:hypothetical protein
MAYSFGPIAWKCLNVIAQNFSKFRKPDIEKLFTDLGKYLPCKGCRQHYISFIRDTVWESTLYSKESFIIFLTNLHNSVNWRQQKEIIDYPTASELILSSVLPPHQEIKDCLPKAIYSLFVDIDIFL